METISTTQNPARTVQQAKGFAIFTEKLTKSYGPARGINELDLQVREGEIFGFLGPNGAGKTTTIRLLLNLIFPTSGRALVNGLDSQRDSVEIKKQIGYLPGEFSLYPGLTGAQTLQYFSNLRGEVEWPYVLELAERLELDLGKKFRQYSRGNKQKVGIIQALMHRPRLLILDEPTSGLDPLNQQEFYKLLHEARQKGSTIFFSSHIMSEVEKTCDRVAIIRGGELVRVGGLDELSGIKTQQLELTFGDKAPQAEIRALVGVSQLEAFLEGSHEGLRCVAQAEVLDNLLRVAISHHLINIATREPSLEEVFLQYYSDGN